MFDKLKETLEDYKRSNLDVYQLYGGESLPTLRGESVPLLGSIITPLMKRFHRYVKQSGELVFINATSNTEEHNLKVFVLCTHSVAGAFPCGILITSDEKESALKSGFEMLKSCLPQDAFYGRGCNGTDVLMMGNCDEERSALLFLWTSVKQLLCTFHILQQV